MPLTYNLLTVCRSMCVRIRYLYQHGAGELRRVQTRDSRGIWYIRSRGFSGSYIYHRRHPHESLASVSLWVCVRTKGYHE